MKQEDSLYSPAIVHSNNTATQGGHWNVQQETKGRTDIS